MPAVGPGIVPFGDPDSFLRDVLESSTEYSIIAADPGDAGPALERGGAKVYSYAPTRSLVRICKYINAPEERVPGKVEHVLQLALLHGKWEGVLRSRRKSGEAFPARVVCTVLKDNHGAPMGTSSSPRTSRRNTACTSGWWNPRNTTEASSSSAWTR